MGIASRTFKYATRQFGDDDALEIIEAMIKSNLRVNTMYAETPSEARGS
jgi:hypothetical protein